MDPPFLEPDWIGVEHPDDAEFVGDLAVGYSDAVLAEYDELVASSVDEIRRFPGVTQVESYEPGSIIVIGTRDHAGLRRHLTSWWREQLRHQPQPQTDAGRLLDALLDRIGEPLTASGVPPAREAMDTHVHRQADHLRRGGHEPGR